MAPAQPSAQANEKPLGLREFRAVAAIVQADARIELSEAKITLVHSRLSRRLREHGLSSFKDYIAFVQRDASERAHLVTALTTNHTHFFRERHHFDHFVTQVRPSMQARPRDLALRLWSAGCSSGEEVYSLAMCLLGQSSAEASWVKNRDVRLLATDIAPPVVASVARGRYSAETVRPVPNAYRNCWMQADGADFTMTDAIRAMVTARELNLFAAWPMRKQYDVIFCRNVMIYFDAAASAELQARLVAQLAPGGFLYIGHSERLTGSAAAAMTSCGHTIYRKAGGR